MINNVFQHEQSNPISLVFLGAGPLAAKSLEHLHSNFTIETVITKPNLAKAKSIPPVVKYCQDNKIPYFTPLNKLELNTLVSQQSFASRFGVVVDYGIIVAQSVIDSFPLGIVNSHFSLLPEWRGADPITFAILSGQAKTGVSLMLIDEKMDEGPVIAQSSIDLPTSVTASKLTDLLLDLSNNMMTEILPIFFSGQTQGIPQNQLPDAPPVSYSRKLNKKDGKLDFTKSANELEREIRAFIEWPKSYTNLGELEVIITEAHVVASTSSKVGELNLTKDKCLVIQCGKDGLAIDKIKPAGKKAMSTADFIRGYGSKISTEIN